ncbi:YbjQ family protein [Flavobacterium sp.]|uniref:YbjQ family protein n=1 Tax=Flavobacterium sp. TaxID=239 RepID=UPI003529A6E1
MILTTTNSIEGFTIAEYIDIVSGTAVNAQKMTMTFNMQKFYDGISESIDEVKTKAFEHLKENADKLNANAVVGIKVDIDFTASNFITVFISGTAVKILKTRTNNG